MAKIIEIENIKKTRLFASEFIAQLTEECQIFLFSYSPSLDCLISWSDNALSILGVKDVDLALRGNIFLRHIVDSDRYRFLNELEDALKGNSLLTCQYSWIRPDNNKKISLLCRGKLIKNAYTEAEDLFEGFIVSI